MATFKNQVQGITSLTVGTTPTDDELSQFLVDGTKEVVNRIITIRPDEIGKFTLSTNDASDAGVTLTGQVISVVREHDSVTILRDCSSISPGERYAASDSTSLSYRSKYNPGFYILDGKIHTVPASAGSDNDSIITQVHYAVNQGHSSSSIDNFPNEYEYLVVLYASLRSLHATMGAKTTPLSVVFLDTPSAPSIDSLATVAFSETNALSITATAPSALSLSAIYYMGISDIDTGSVADVVHTTLNITGATQPAYNSGAVIGLADETLTVEMIDTALSVTDLSVIAVPPDVPSIPNFTLTVGTPLPTYAAPTTTINGTLWATAYPDQHTAISTALGKITTEIGLAKAEVLEAVGDTDSSSSGYVTAFAAMKNELDKVDEICTKADEEFNEVAVETSGTATSPISSAKTLAIAKLTLDPFTLTAVPPDIPTFTAVTYAGATVYTIADTSAHVVSLGDVVSTAPVFTGTVPNYLPADPPTRPDMETAITEQDIEMLSAKAQQYQADLGAMQADMADSTSSFNASNVSFQADVQKDMASAQTINQAVLQNLQKNLTIAQADASAENTTRATTAVNDMQVIMNDNQKALSKWQQELSQYQAEVGAEVQDYSQYLAEQQQEFGSIVQVHQTLLGEATARLSAGSSYLQEAQSRMAQAQGYAGEISSRSGFTSTKLAVVSSYIQTASAYAAESQALLAPKAAEVSEYQARVGNSLNLFNTELQKYQAELGKELQEAQYEQQAEHAASLQQYQGELSAYQAEVASEVQEWQANTNKDLQVWQQSQAMALQEHSQRMQDALNLFNEESVEYQAEVQAETQQASINQQENMQNMQKALQIAIRDKDRSQEHQLQEATQDTQALIAENQRKIGQYQAELGLYTAQVNKEVQDYTLRLQTDMKTMEGVIANNQNLLAKFQALMGKYSAEVQTYQADASSEIAKYQAELQANQAEYQWLQDQYARVKAEYDSAFIALTPRGQGANAQQEQPRA